MSKYVVEMKDIRKSFDFVKAVSDGHFNLKKGEIHSLIGENGAGKSTMMKLLYGLYPLDSGEIRIGDEVMTELTPSKVIERGIGMVHQEFMLVDELTVLENIILGFEPKKGVQIDFKAAAKAIQKYIDNYHMDVQLNKRINQISVGEAQRVEIIKTLYRGADILILDEPTAVLTPQETDKFFEILRSLKADGKSIVFISHKLNEVMEISDRITVMRQGKYEGTMNASDTSPEDLARRMVGRDVLLRVEKESSEPGETILEIKDLWTSGDKEISKIRGIDLTVLRGEILGVAGIDGNGQSELIEAINGLRKVERGTIKINGIDITNKSPLEIRESGIAHVPEDRNTRGLNRSFNIMDNLLAVKFNHPPFSRGIAVDEKEKKKFSETLIERFDIRPKDPFYLVEALSGGNAQKIVIAREVANEGSLLIAAQPTRGVDIGAIESIRQILNDVKSSGRGILLVSADLDEILSLADRIAVMYEGKIMGILDDTEANKENIGELMMGGAEVIKRSAGEAI